MTIYEEYRVQLTPQQQKMFDKLMEDTVRLYDKLVWDKLIQEYNDARTSE